MFVIQLHGFTCGVNDLLIRDEKDRERKKQLEECEKIGKEIHLKALQHEDDAGVKDVIEVKDSDEIGMLFFYKTSLWQFEFYLVSADFVDFLSQVLMNLYLGDAP